MGREGGSSLLEVQIAGALLIVALSGIAGSLLSSASLHQSNAEVGLATQAAREVIEEFRTMTIADAFARFNSVAQDDPLGAGTAPGPRFTVPGLTPLPEDRDGAHGQIFFPVKNASDQQFSETPGNVFGLEVWDLDLDGKVKTSVTVASARLAPVVVRVRWRGTTGAMSVELRTVLSDED